MQPIELVQHEARPKPDGAPIAQVIIDPSRSAIELASGNKQPTIMLEIVNANLESVLNEFVSEFLRNGIIGLRNKVKGGMKPAFSFESHHVPAFPQTKHTFDIVRQDKCEFLAFRPSRPVLWWVLRAREDRPDVRDAMTQA
ncbi:MAG: hypothetical protein ACRD3P_06725 [Terriglobales bacterium]